ncbi:MAG TPA: baseplate J/gp47 family protein [Pyrinomonadaceae bacterium]|nr:baseplate J/gp47 family protein [Pyrinomonadaceae bacterium]
MSLLVAPDLDIRDEEALAAEAIARTSGSLTVERVDSLVVMLRDELRPRVAAGELIPVCPELTNANPSSPHTVLLEVMGWLLAQIARRINRLPERDAIEFHRLFGIELREATAATTTLEFAATPVEDVDVVVPAGTQVTTGDGLYVFETDAELVIPYPETEGSVTATRTVAGRLLLAPGTLVVMEDAIAFVSGVSNPEPVDSGTDAETVDQALLRARNYQRRAERLVSARDVEDFVLEEVLGGNGIVRAFPFVRAVEDEDLTAEQIADAFAEPKAGHTTIVVMTSSGAAVSQEVKDAIHAGLEQMIGSQFMYILDPQFVTFSVNANIKIEGITPQLAIVAAVEKNLRDFYATKKGNFGRRVLRSEIIAIIEGTPGVDRIVSDEDGPIVGTPAADLTLAPYQLPKLENVTLTVVP